MLQNKVLGSEHAEKYKETWLKWKPEGYTGNRKRESSLKKVLLIGMMNWNESNYMVNR